VSDCRYALRSLTARTTEQKAQGYAEDKMEVGSTGGAVWISSRQAGDDTGRLVIK